MTLARCTRILLFMLLSSLSGNGQRTDARHGDSSAVSLCELVEHSAKYVEKSVTTTVRITATKHVTELWDPACPNLGVDLWFRQPETTSPGMLQLHEALNTFGMGDHPVIATLTGTWMGEQYREHQFIQQPRIVLEVIDAADVHRSTKVERRRFVAPK